MTREDAVRNELYQAEKELDLIKSGAVPIGGSWGPNARKEAEERVYKAHEALEAWFRSNW